MQLNLNQFYVFYICSQCKNFTSASKALNVSVPAVSMQIKKLESFLTFSLFKRKSGTLELTEKAKELLPIVNEMFSHAKDLDAKIGSIMNQEKSKIIIGLHLVPAQTFVPELLLHVQEFMPHIELEFVHGNQRELIDKLQNKELDLILIASEIHSPNIILQEFLQFEILYAVCHTNPIIKEQPIKLERLAQLPTLLPSKDSEGSGFSMHIQKFYSEKQISFSKANLKMGTLISKNFLSNSDYGAFYPSFQVAKELAEGKFVKLQLCDVPPPLRFYFAYLKGLHIPEAQKEILEYLRLNQDVFHFVEKS